MIPTNVESFLKQGNIISNNETFQDMVERVFTTVADFNYSFGSSKDEVIAFKDKLTNFFINGYFVPSTPILTNVGRHKEKPTSACSVVYIGKKMDREKLETLVNQYHKNGMGTGFNFDETLDPVEELLFLNRLALKEEGNIERPVGNLALLSVDHPKILEFIEAKSIRYRHLHWMFNTSVNATKEFMESLKNRKRYALRDGTMISSEILFNKLAEAAHFRGDPGLVFMDRLESYNITPHLGKYISLAPCGEIPMAEGETCQFAYINVNNFLKNRSIDYSLLGEVIYYVTFMLDNTLEISIKNIQNERSREMMLKKRKIGVGVCGFSDLLISLGVPYESDEARRLGEDLMSFINYESKIASVELAKQRGPFLAFYDSETKRDLITDRYLDKESRTVVKSDWVSLREKINEYGIRNVSTTAIPPTGRSSLIIGASASIEPLFNLSLDKKIEESILENLPLGVDYSWLDKIQIAIRSKKSLQDTRLPHSFKIIYKTCLELIPQAHLRMVASFQRYTDESISKTVNLPNHSTIKDIKDIFLLSDELKLKGITVYRDGCLDNQPIKL